MRFQYGQSSLFHNSIHIGLNLSRGFSGQGYMDCPALHIIRILIRTKDIAERLEAGPQRSLCSLNDLSKASACQGWLPRIHFHQEIQSHSIYGELPHSKEKPLK